MKEEKKITTRKKQIPGFLKKTGKVVLWTLAGILLLLASIIILIQVPAIQDFARKKTVDYLEKNLQTPLSIKKLRVAFPKMLILEDVYFEDQQGDTLLYGKNLGVNLQMWGLLRNKLVIDEVLLEDVYANIQRNDTGRYNFDYIIDAFSGPPDTTASQKTSGGMEIKAGLVKLNRVRIWYRDQFDGLDMHYQIDQLRAGFKTLDTDPILLDFQNLTWFGGLADIKMVTPSTYAILPQSDSDATPTKFTLKIGLARMGNIQFRYKNAGDGMDMQADIGNLRSQDFSLDLAKQDIGFGTLDLSNSSYALQAMEPTNPKNTTTNPTAKDWVVNAGKISLMQSLFAYDDQTSKPTNKGMDYSHMLFKNINLEGKNLHVVGADTVSANILKGNFFEKSGFDLRELRTKLTYTSQGISLNDLYLRTPTTRIEESISVGYTSPSDVAANPGTLLVDANLKNTTISHKDLLTVVPMLYEYPLFTEFPRATMKLSGKVNGRLDNLNLYNVDARLFDGTRIRASGNIKGLPDPNRIVTDLNVQELTLKGSDIEKIIPKSLFPEGFTLPATATIKGSLKGSVETRLVADLFLSGSYGELTLKGYIDQPMEAKKARFDLKVGMKAFDMGALLGRSEEIGKITLQADAKGTGYDPTMMSGQYEANIQAAQYIGYTYKDITMKANAQNGIFNINSSSSTPELEYALQLRADLQKETPNVSTEINLKNIDFQQLGFMDYPLSFGGQISAIFPEMDIERPEGTLLITDIKGVYDTLNYQLDTLSLIASNKQGEQTLYAKSSFFSGSIAGDYTLTGIFPELLQFINTHYGFFEPTPALAGNQKAKIHFQVNPSPQLAQFLPGLEMEGPLSMDLDFDSRLCIFDLKGNIPGFTYGINNIKGGSFFAIGNDTSIGYKIYINDYDNGVTFIPTGLLQGDIVHSIVYFDLKLLDNTGRLQHTLAAKMEKRDDGYAFHFDPNSVLLDYEDWGLDPGNELLLAPEGLFAQSFTFSNGSQALVLQTFGDSATDPIGVRLFNFQIGTFTSIARQDSLYLNGIVNGTAEIDFNAEHMQVLADITIEDITYKKDSIGDLSLKIENSTADLYNIEAEITGFGNIAHASGNYNSNSGVFDLNLDVEKLMLRTIEPFTLGYLNKMKGHLEGGISISGTSDKPMLVGNLLFRDAEANAPLLNSVFSLRNERIRFLSDGMHFDDFTLTDAEGKKAILKGTLLTETWRSYRFNLDFEANNFRVINSTKRDNNLFYGILYLDSKISFRGNTDRPSIEAKFRANDKTNLTMVMPQDNPEIAQREGIVEFIDPEHPFGDNALTLKMDSLSQSGIFGLNLNADIEIDKDAIMSFVIDDNTGDALIAKGEASLYGGIDPSGKITMTGIYELSEGSYETSLANLTRRKFSIQKGSTIIWTGEPTTADIDITAVYNIRTPPFDLVEAQILDENPQTQTLYRERLPFDVLLNMKGELMKPDIRFNIKLDQNVNTSIGVITTVNSKLEQLRLEQSEMNKQVFALILLNRFVAENPFSSSTGGGGVSAFARQSVSRLLEDQLNALAGNLIEGVDFDFGLNSETDFTSGGGQARTDLNVGISTNLLKDRLKISVGSNFELEGANRPNQKTTNIAGNIEIDYMLSRDGQYLLRAYRKDEYEVALQGQVIETGVSFIITLDFDTFREIFDNRKSRKAIKKSAEKK